MATPMLLSYFGSVPGNPAAALKQSVVKTMQAKAAAAKRFIKLPGEMKILQAVPAVLPSYLAKKERTMLSKTGRRFVKGFKGSEYFGGDEYAELFLGSNWFTNLVAKLDPTSSTAPLGKAVKSVLSTVANIVVPGSGVALNAALTKAHQVGAAMKAKGANAQQIYTELKKEGYSESTAAQAITETTGVNWAAQKNPLLQTLSNPIFLAAAGAGVLAIVFMTTRKGRK